MSQALHPMLNTAIKAARAAGSIINRAALDLEVLKIGTKGPNDYVSEVDRAAEAAIIEILLEAYPGHAILAEESGREHGAKHSEYTWIIDPLDGTTNFLHGFPVYAVSIGLAFRGKVEQAVVYDPTRNDLFFASKGRGAFLNDRRLRVSKRTRITDALIGTGFPFRKGDNFKRYVKMFEEVMQHCAGLRRPGAAALDLCYVAAGYYDGFFETGLNPWDVAAAIALVEESGGKITDWQGKLATIESRVIVAANEILHGQFLKLIGTDESHAIGQFLRTGNLEALALLDDAPDLVRAPPLAGPPMKRAPYTAAPAALKTGLPARSIRPAPTSIAN